MNRLKEARKACGMRQIDVAKAIGIGQSGYSDWEREKNKIDNESLSKLAEILNVSADYLLGKDTQPQSNNLGRLQVAVLGDVAAGIPIEAIQDIVDYEEIDEAMAATGEFFGLRLKGRSMEPRMCDGDVVIVRKQPCVETGEIAVVLVNGDSATVKKVKTTDAGIMLIPFNPEFETMFYDQQQMETLPVTILGKVVELRGKF